jgi:hypothetical protein
MKPVTYDFDVITDAPAPRRRAPEPAEQAPPSDAEKRRQAAPPEKDEREKVLAAE